MLVVIFSAKKRQKFKLILNPLYTFKTLVLVLLWSNLVQSQEVSEQIEFKIENDKLFFIDRYYTNGLFVSYKRNLKSNFIFKTSANSELQLKVTLGNETYTPKNLSSFNVNDFDRPFAGWLFGAFEIGKIKQNSAFFIALETGVTGEESLSGKLQTEFHHFFNIDNPTWVEEIAYKWLFNIKARYYFNWELNSNSALLYEMYPVLGIKDVFFENSLHYYFGRFNGLKNSSRLGVIDKTNTNEFFGNIALGYRYVIHNTLIQGSIFKKDILFTTSPSRHVLHLKIEGVLKHSGHTYKLRGSFNSKETPTSIWHAYGSFIYSKNF